MVLADGQCASCGMAVRWVVACACVAMGEGVRIQRKAYNAAVLAAFIELLWALRVDSQIGVKCASALMIALGLVEIVWTSVEKA